MNKETLTTVGIAAVAVLAGLFLWRGVIRANAPAGLIGHASNL